MKQEIDITRLNGNKTNGQNGNNSTMQILEKIDLIGDMHVSTSIETPMRKDAFKLSDDEKINSIGTSFGKLWKQWG
jgi:GTP cyclohydrolase I